jgi:hypothetical protein
MKIKSRSSIWAWHVDFRENMKADLKFRLENSKAMDHFGVHEWTVLNMGASAFGSTD